MKSYSLDQYFYLAFKIKFGLPKYIWYTEIYFPVQDITEWPQESHFNLFSESHFNFNAS